MATESIPNFHSHPRAPHLRIAWKAFGARFTRAGIRPGSGDWRYDLWLAVKFLPFALWTGYVVDRRPTALPYLMGLHFLIDVSLPVVVLMVSRGMALS